MYLDNLSSSVRLAGMEWGAKIRQLREQRGITQTELAKRAGVTRGYIAQIETGLIKESGMDTFRRLASGLGMTLDELDAAVRGETLKPTEEPEDWLERYRAAQPYRLQIRTDFVAHAGEPVQPPQYYWIPRGGAAPVGIEAIKVKGNCLEPVIQEGDVIIVDKNAEVNIGNVVACTYQDELHLGRLRKIAGEVFLENGHGTFKLEECPHVAKVIQIERTLR